MKYEIDFDKGNADSMIYEIYSCFCRTEDAFSDGDLPRNIRNACAYSELVRTLRIFGASVNSTGIYNDNGFDRIGYGKINGHEFIKNAEFNLEELKTALYELAGVVEEVGK